MKNNNTFYYKVKENFESEDISFKIGFGDKEYVSYLTLWSNDFTQISANIENYIYEGVSGIELDFDTEPTIVNLRRVGTMVNAEIIPSHFCRNTEIMRGQFVEKSFLRRLYDGILFGTVFCYDSCGCGLNWYDCKMVCYNMVKSRMVEEYLRDIQLMI